jgi:hypothetical protein
MPDHDTPPAADPRRGKNPGYAEDQPRDHRDARQPAIPSQPAPDEAGIEYDAEADPVSRKPR